MAPAEQKNASPEESPTDGNSYDLQRMMLNLQNETYHYFNSKDAGASPSLSEESKDPSDQSSDDLT